MADIALRPMTLGEVLDHTFSLYKRNFWLFAGIVALPYLIVVIFNFFFSNSFGTAVPAPGATVSPGDAARLLGALFGAVAVILLFSLVVFSVAQAATVMAVSDLYLGHESSVHDSFTRIRSRILAVLFAMALVYLIAGVAMILCGSLGGVLMAVGMILFHPPNNALLGIAMVVLLLPITFVPGIILLCRGALVVPVATLEPLGPGRAVARSFRLTKGSGWSVFAVYVLVVFLAYLAIAVFQGPFLLAEGNPLKPHALPVYLRVLQGVASWVSGVIVFPIGTIAFSLIYYNQRVRKEAFDLEQLVAALGPRETPPSPSAA